MEQSLRQTPHTSKTKRTLHSSSNFWISAACAASSREGMWLSLVTHWFYHNLQVYSYISQALRAAVSSFNHHAGAPQTLYGEWHLQNIKKTQQNMSPH